MSSPVSLKGTKLFSSVLCSKKNIFLFVSRGFKISPVTHGFKTEFNIKWVRPEKLSFYHPAKTGDLKPLASLENEKLPSVYEGLEELKDANPLVHKVFSCGFQGRRFATERLFESMVNSVKAHEFDDESMEYRIARQTHKIRNLVAHLEKIGNEPRGRMLLNEFIHRRKRFLCDLRERDYKKFEWLLDKLDLVFKPHPSEGCYIRIERKASVRKLTNLHCEKIMDQKWEDYKEYLESQKGDFLKKKVETLKWARQEQIDCNVEPTVSEENVKKAEKELAEFLVGWEAKQMSKPVVKVRK